VFLVNGVIVLAVFTICFIKSLNSLSFNTPLYNLNPCPNNVEAINWAVLKLSILFPYVFIPYFRHKRWEREFYKNDTNI